MGATPAQALTGVVALALAAYGGWCCLRRDHHQHKMGEPEGAGGSGDGNGAAPQEIDEDLHSRQLAVYRRETMRRLFTSDVLVSGLNGR